MLGKITTKIYLMFIKDFYSTNILKVVHQAKRYTNGGIGGDNEDVSK